MYTDSKVTSFCLPEKMKSLGFSFPLAPAAGIPPVPVAVASPVTSAVSEWGPLVGRQSAFRRLRHTSITCYCHLVHPYIQQCTLVIILHIEIITPLYEGCVVSVHRMVMENRPVDPGSIQGSHRPISFIRIKHSTRANVFVVVKLSINTYFVS